MNYSLKDLIQFTPKRLDNIVNVYLGSPSYSAKTLQEAMTYAIKNGGKRLRPLLIYSIGQLFNVPLSDLDAPACAMELIHTYSLVHDDLPAMDNSDLRRGKPSCHKAFNEASAILAGDALQSLAFEVLAAHPANLSSEQRLKMIAQLSKASGLTGMAGGQQLDLEGVNSIESLTQMYQLKTGALFTACIHLGCIASNVTDDLTIKALEKYIENIGLAFQIQDDLLDLQGDTQLIGKPAGLDSLNEKLTYPNILGIEQAQNLVNKLFQDALLTLESLPVDTSLLQEVANYIMKRQI